MDFANKTACSALNLQAYMGPRPHLWICACKTEALGPELQLSMGPRPLLWFGSLKTA